MTSMTANQLVAYNLARIRKAQGLSQEQAAAMLAPWLGVRWSKAVYSAAERSYDGKRVRQFTADDLIAMSGAFGVPVLYFFLPAKAEDRGSATSVGSGEHDVTWRELFDVMLGGPYRSALFPRVLELPPQDRPAAGTRLGQLIALVSANGSAAAERDRQAEELRDKSLQQPVVAAIVTSALGVLVGRRNDRTPPWGFISGEIEPGELAEDAAVREVKEETGLEVRVGHVIGERDHPDTGRHMIYIAAEPTRGVEVYVGDEAELAEVRWVSVDEAGELLPGMFGPVREYLGVGLGEA
jgi:8-oxo-dGTP diphosphatase